MHGSAALRGYAYPERGTGPGSPALSVAPRRLLGRRLLRGHIPVNALMRVVIADGIRVGVGIAAGVGVVANLGPRIDVIGVAQALLDVLALFGDRAAMAVG